MIAISRIAPSWRAFVRWGEDLPVGPIGWLLALGALALVRTATEIVSQQLPNGFAPERWAFFLHAPLFYLAAFFGVALILSATTGERLGRTARFTLAVAPLILFPPLIDLLVSGGRGAVMAYRELPPIAGAADLARTFVDFVLWSPYGLLFTGSNAHFIAQLGINYGIRLEVLVELLIFVWYLFIKTKSAIRVLAGSVLLYGGLFALGTLPSLVGSWAGMSLGFLAYGKISVLQPNFRGDNLALAAVLALIVAAEALAALVLWSAPKARAFLGNLRPARLVLNLAVFSAGLALGLARLPSGTALSFFDGLLVALGYFAIAAYWAWAVAANDLADAAGDGLSMPARPLPSGALSRGEMATLGKIALLFSWLAAFLVGWGVFSMVLIRTALGVLYSYPPFRVKRVPILSNFIIGCAHLSAVTAGYLLFAGNSIVDFPSRFALAFLVAYTLIAEFKNIKDIAGDQAENVRTIPVIFGEERGALVSGLLGVAGFLVFPALYREFSAALFPAALMAGTAYYYSVTRKPYRENLVFGAIFLFVGLLGILWSRGGFVP